jgi:uncharacterized membrane protein required for colicin V production
MRKREALKKALTKPIKFPKIRESTKLLICGAIIWFICIIISFILPVISKASLSIILSFITFFLGFFLLLWFVRAYNIMYDEELKEW